MDGTWNRIQIFSFVLLIEIRTRMIKNSRNLLPMQLLWKTTSVPVQRTRMPVLAAGSPRGLCWRSDIHRVRALAGQSWWHTSPPGNPRLTLLIIRIALAVCMSAGPTEVNANTVTRQPGYRRITLLLPSIIATAVYSDDSDLDSKSTFPMLGQLAQLRAGDAKSVAPVLTLPVGN